MAFRRRNAIKVVVAACNVLFLDSFDGNLLACLLIDCQPHFSKSAVS